jgi:hypothetical protein
MLQKTEWTEGDLEGLISGSVAESLELDYKASLALERSEHQKKELSKDVSAFANSAGGVLIYGILEKENRVADSIDKGSDPGDISREWIDQVITSTIHPRIAGLRIHQVPLNRCSPGKVAYVVEIPPGHTAHMASDNRYYKRHNFHSRPMEDYEVRDVMHRDVAPCLQLRLTASLVAFGDSGDNAIELTLSMENMAEVPAEFFVVQIVIPVILNILDDGGAQRREALASDSGVPVTALHFPYGGSSALPCWKGLNLFFTQRPIRLALPTLGSYPIFGRVTAPRMDWFRESLQMTYNGVNVMIQSVSNPVDMSTQ